MLLQISNKAFNLLPDHGPKLYIDARNKLVKKPWGLGHTWQGNLDHTEFNSFLTRVSEIRDGLTGGDRQALNTVMTRMWKL